MSDNYDLTGNQRDAWRARVLPLFARDNNCFSLAEKGGFDERDRKNAAGYIGEFRDGKPRALRYFLGEPARLRKLAKGLETSVSALETFWREVQEGEATGAGTLWLPGFEDWGPVALEDGFVAPPTDAVSGGDATVDLRTRVLSKLDGGISVVGESGAGVTTMLRRIAAWAEADGWRVTWGISGGLPEGKASLLVIDGFDIGDPDELKEWGKAPGHAVLRGSDGFRPWRLVSSGFTTLGGQMLRIRPVDAAWLARFVDTAARLAPRGEAKRLRSLPPAALQAVLESLPAPSPELAGCLVREALDGRRLDVAAQGVRYVLDAAQRRLVGQRRREHVALLRRGEEWLANAYLGWIAHPAAPVAEPLERGLLDRARTALADIQATEEQREILRSVLPFASGAAVVEALGDARVVREEEDGSTRLRMEPLLAPALAHRIVANTDTLRAALLARRRVVLGAVARAPGGPAALAAVLRALDPPALAVALGSIDRDADWLVRVRWDAPLVARVLATWLVTGEVQSSFMRTGLFNKRSTPLPPLWTVLGSAPALPTVEAVQRELEATSAALFTPRPSWDDATLTMILALAAPTAAALGDSTVWDALPENLFPPEGWIEHLAQTTEGLLFLTDPRRSPVALRILRLEKHFSILKDPEPVHAWLALVSRLFAAAPEAAIELLSGIVLSAVEATRAHPGEPVDPTEAYCGAGSLQEFFDWQNDVHLMLWGVASATELPEARRHLRTLRARLREAMGAWEPLADDQALPIEPWQPRRFVDRVGGRLPLRTLLAFCYTPEERARFLVTADGHLSPYWDACVRAGVPIDASLRLLRGVECGDIPWRPGRGAPTAREAQRHDEQIGDLPVPSVVDWIRDTILEVSTPDEIGQVKGFTSPDSGQLPGEETFARRLGWRSIRAYLWRFVGTLGEDDVIWRLLERRTYEVPFEKAEEFAGKGGFAEAFADRSGLSAAIQRVPAASLTPARWNRIADAALYAGVPASELGPLLESPAVAGAREALVLAVLQRVLGVNTSRVAEWLVARLHDRPTLVDRATFAPVWVAARVEAQVLEAWLAGRPEQPRGEGVVRALVLLGHERFAEWLADAGTRDAALGALAMSADWPTRLAPALAERATIPSDAVLAHLLVQRGGVGFDVLDEAAAAWPPDRRRALWEAAARVATHRWHRTEIWRRLAGV